jgi:hypothetical protein
MDLSRGLGDVYKRQMLTSAVEIVADQYRDSCPYRTDIGQITQYSASTCA